jgi:hypothetical protein
MPAKKLTHSWNQARCIPGIRGDKHDIQDISILFSTSYEKLVRRSLACAPRWATQWKSFPQSRRAASACRAVRFT